MQEVLWHPDTYDFARGLSLGNHSSSLWAAVVEQSGRRVLPFLDPSASPVGAPYFSCLPRLGGLSSSSSSFSWEECVSELSDEESDITLRRRPFRVPVAFFLAFFTGTS